MNVTLFVPHVHSWSCKFFTALLHGRSVFSTFFCKDTTNTDNNWLTMFLLQLGLSSTILLSLGNNKTNVSTHADKSNMLWGIMENLLNMKTDFRHGSKNLEWPGKRYIMKRLKGSAARVLRVCVCTFWISSGVSVEMFRICCASCTLIPEMLEAAADCWPELPLACAAAWLAVSENTTHTLFYNTTYENVKAKVILHKAATWANLSLWQTHTRVMIIIMLFYKFLLSKWKIY